MVTGFANEETEDNLKKYAALRMIDVLKKQICHETLIKIGAYVLSEFGDLIAKEQGKGIQEQFELINRKLPKCHSAT